MAMEGKTADGKSFVAKKTAKVRPSGTAAPPPAACAPATD